MPAKPARELNDAELRDRVLLDRKDADEALEALAELEDRAADRALKDLETADRPEHPNLTAALAAAQAEFPPIHKGSTATIPGKDGKSGYSYSYAELGDVLGAVRPVLARHGIALVQRTVLPDQAGGKVRLVTELRHVAGDVLESSIELGHDTRNPQAFGGALTYLRRYEAVTLLGVAAEEDRDAQDVPPPPRERNGQAPELPAWARPTASNERLAEIGEALTPLVGRDRARAFVTTVRNELTYVPDVVVATTKLLAAYVEGALEDTGRLEAHRRELPIVLEERAKEAAAAKADTDAQDASGEPEPAEPGADGTGDDRDGEEVEPEDGPGDHDASKAPPAGTVEPPAMSEHPNDEEAEAALRRAGCTCKEPLVAAGRVPGLDPKSEAAAEHVDDGCPIKGHGIPF